MLNFFISFNCTVMCSAFSYENLKNNNEKMRFVFWVLANRHESFFLVFTILLNTRQSIFNNKNVVKNANIKFNCEPFIFRMILTQLKHQKMHKKKFCTLKYRNEWIGSIFRFRHKNESHMNMKI